MRSFIQVEAQPYAWPLCGTFDTTCTALLMIDWQHDFCGRGGYVDTMGYDIERLRAAIPPARSVLNIARNVGMPVIHTREGHRPDLSDLPATKLARSIRMGARIGSQGPHGRILVRGEAGWEIIPELAPIDGEIVIDKPGKGAFYATDLDAIVRQQGTENLVLCGLTTDVCVHTTMREANDRGLDCLLLSDCTAAVDEQNYLASLRIVTMSGGVFGAISNTSAFRAALDTDVRAGSRDGDQTNELSGCKPVGAAASGIRHGRTSFSRREL